MDYLICVVVIIVGVFVGVCYVCEFSVSEVLFVMVDSVGCYSDDFLEVS